MKRYLVVAAALASAFGCQCGQIGAPPGSEEPGPDVTAPCEQTGSCSSARPGEVPTGAPGCGGERIESKRMESNMLVVLDRSLSMADTLGSGSKWSIALGAVNKLVREHEESVWFGLELFPGANDACAPGAVAVPIGAKKAADISAALSGSDGPFGRTPLAAALITAGTVPELTAPDRAQHVLLLTDGRETCNAEPIGEVEALRAKGIRTFVVGFGGEVNPEALALMAEYGGTARPGAQKYYQADEAATLDTAMAEIAAGVVGCDFKLSQVVADPNRIFVYVNGKLVARDLSRQEGWDYEPGSRQLGLYGSACVRPTAGSPVKVDVSFVYGCPDDALVEGGGNRGDGGPSGSGPDGGLEEGGAGRGEDGGTLN